MGYKIKIEQLHLYNKKHVLISDAMDIGMVADREIAVLKKRNYHLENTRLKASNKIKADAIREMMDFCANQEKYCGLDKFSVSEIREYIDLLEEENDNETFKQIRNRHNTTIS